MNAFSNLEFSTVSSADTETQQMLVDSARRWAERACEPEQRARSSSHAFGCPPERWRELAELGWLGIALPEADGGLGAGLPELSLLAEQLGHALLVEPFVASGVLGSTLLAQVAEGELRKAWVPAIASGERRVTWAAWEADGNPALCQASAKATRHGDAWTVSGAKGLMPGAGGADGLLVTAHFASDDAHMGLFLIDGHEKGVALSSQRLYDGRHGAKLQLDHATGALLKAGPVEKMLNFLDQALDLGRVAHCAETLGTAQAAFDITLEYVRTRRQFGRALGQNQIVQHRLVDLYVEIQEARALCLSAAAHPTPRHVAALSLRTGQVARHTWEEAIQLHGAIGMTEEYVLGEYVRRLALAADLYGNGPDHADRLAALSLETALEASLETS